MVIHAYSMMRNEMKILPYFMRHYRQFVSQFFIFDDLSDDGSREYLADFDNVMIQTPKVHGIDDRYFRMIYQNEYRYRSRGVADFVICCDADEFIYHPDLVGVLERCKAEGVKIVKPTGFTMFSERFPSTDGQIYDEVKMGVRDIWYDKPIILDPSIDMRFDIGRHGMRHDHYNLEHSKIGTDTGINLLHFRYLGDEYAKLRSDVGYSRMSESNLKWGLAKHMDPGSTYFHSAHWFNENKGMISKCID